MFKSIKAKNFFSWSDLEFDFQSGITLLQGINKDDNTLEGVGKSSICEALVWCLFGQCTKDVNIDDVIQTGSKSCTVYVTLTDGTMICRSRKPNDLFILPSVDTPPKRGKDAKETQKLINELIGMTFNTFCNSIYFAQNYQNKFITATQEDKAKILSELQDLSVFDKATKHAVEKVKEIKFNLPHLNSSKIHSVGKLELIQKQLQTFNELSSNFENDRILQLDNITDKHDKLASEIRSIEAELATLADLSILTTKSQELESLESEAQQMEAAIYHIDFLKDKKQKAFTTKTCPTCGQNIADCSDIVVPDDTQLRQDFEKILPKLTALRAEVQRLTEQKHQRAFLAQKFTYLLEQRYEIHKEVVKLENQNNPHIDSITDLAISEAKTSKTLDLLNKDIAQRERELQHYDFLKSGFKEIKSYVFQSLLAQLNTKTNKYLAELFEIPARIQFNNLSEEGEISKITTTVILDNTERSLGLLSGGQFRRVQLAVDFALSEIIAEQANKPITLRILDEAFKDLSEVSMNKVVDILEKMPGSTILIEHSSLVKAIVNRTFEIEYKNGVSTHD
jgi:DNA repair exonuclease SbcCD ATPase subunit